MATKQINGRKMIDARHARLDTQIAAGLITAILISPQGVKVLQQMLQSAKDPVQVLAHVIYGAISKVRGQLHVRKMKIEPKVWTAHGGVLDRVMVELMMFVGTGLKFTPATNPQFVAQVKAQVLQLMESDDKNAEALSMLQRNNLPIPAQPQPQQQQAGGSPNAGAPQQQQQPGLLSGGGQ